MSQSGTACILETGVQVMDAVDQDTEGKGHIEELFLAQC